MKEYINNIQFKLKDFGETYSKYNGYKPGEFKEFIKENKKEIDYHLRELDELIFDQAFGGNSHYFFESYYPDTKTNIRAYKTRVNQITAELNKNFIEYYLDNCNKNKLRIFNIKFYLRYYKTINKIMLKALKRIIKHYKKRGK